MTTMKKIYVKPITEILNSQPSQLMSVSPIDAKRGRFATGDAWRNPRGDQQEVNFDVFDAGKFNFDNGHGQGEGGTGNRGRVNPWGSWDEE